MARLRLSPISFHAEPNRDYVLTMNVLVAAIAAVAAAIYGHASWWSIAIGVGLLAALELSLRSRVTMWFAIVVGTACSAAACAAGAFAIAAGLTRTHDVWWIAAGLGAPIGAWLMIDAHRKLLAARRGVAT